MVGYNQTLEQHCSKNGDVQNEKWLFEAKTCMKEQDSFSIKKEWLIKLKQETYSMNKEFSALIFNFGKQNEENFYILNERDFIQIINLLNEME